MKIATIQYHALKDKHQTLQKAGRLIAQAARRGAKVVVLPENCHQRTEHLQGKSVGLSAELIPGPTTMFFSDLAKAWKITIIAGSLLEKSPVAYQAYNTCVVINAQGEIVAMYRKKNLFLAKINGKKVDENKKMIAGKNNVVVRVASFNIGLSICYDLRFPDLYRACRKQGAEVLCVPSCFTQLTGQSHWEVLLRARAIENLCYVVAPNQIGATANGVALYGNSMIIDPWGKVVVRASKNKEEIIYADLDHKKIKKSREALPQF